MAERDSSNARLDEAMRKANRDGRRRDRRPRRTGWAKGGLFAAFVVATVGFVVIAVQADPEPEGRPMWSVTPKTTVPDGGDFGPSSSGCLEPDGTIRITVPLSLQPLTRVRLVSAELDAVYWDASADEPSVVQTIEVGTAPDGFTTITPLGPDPEEPVLLLVHGDEGLTTIPFEMANGRPFDPC